MPRIIIGLVILLTHCALSQSVKIAYYPFSPPDENAFIRFLYEGSDQEYSFTVEMSLHKSRNRFEVLLNDFWDDFKDNKVSSNSNGLFRAGKNYVYPLPKGQNLYRLTLKCGERRFEMVEEFNLEKGEHLGIVLSENGIKRNKF